MDEVVNVLVDVAADIVVDSLLYVAVELARLIVESVFMVAISFIIG